MHPDANALWTCTTGGFAFDDADVLPVEDQHLAIGTTDDFPPDKLWRPTSPYRAAAGDLPPIAVLLATDKCP